MEIQVFVTFYSDQVEIGYMRVSLAQSGVGVMAS